MLGSPNHYITVHRQLMINRGIARQFPCVACDSKADEWAYDGTDPDELKTLTVHGYPAAYSADLDRYQPMCRKCHRSKDAEKRDGKNEMKYDVRGPAPRRI